MSAIAAGLFCPRRRTIVVIIVKCVEALKLTHSSAIYYVQYTGLSAANDLRRAGRHCHTARSQVDIVAPNEGRIGFELVLPLICVLSLACLGIPIVVRGAEWFDGKG